MVKKRPARREAAKLGRPLKVFTDEQIAQMQDMALEGCQNNTIATIMDISIDTLETHFKKQLSKKRCERKLRLRRQQNKSARDGSAALQIFLGKNVLNQTDKQETTHKIDNLADFLKEMKD